MAAPGGARRSVVARVLRAPVLGGLLGVLALALMLQAAIRSGWVSNQAVALPTAALGAIPDLYSEADITGAFLVTLGMTAPRP